VKNLYFFYGVAFIFVLALFLFSRNFIQHKTGNNTLDDDPQVESENKKRKLEDYNKAIELEPNNYKLFNERGRCKEELGDNTGAIEDYKKAINISRNYAEAYYNMAYCKYKINDKIGACSDWQKSVNFNGRGQKELERYCNEDEKVSDNSSKTDTAIKKKTPLSASEIKSRGFAYRLHELYKNNNTCNFLYVYLNNKPFGRMAKVIYDDFFMRYTVSFVNSKGQAIEFDLKESNFINTWVFNYGGGKYELENNKKGSLFY
jgi:tetratricopeptide (TPR) repeat protein